MAKKKTKNKLDTDFKTVSGTDRFFSKDTLTFSIGLVLLLVACLMLLAFTSYFFTGAADQSLVESAQLSENDLTVGFSNYAGELGARTAYFWMNECFGISSYFIPIFLIFLSMKLMRAYKVRIWKWFLHCSVLMVWLSVALAFFANPYFDRSFICPGGQHGQFICNWLVSRVGTPGIIFILLITAIIYLIFLTDQTIAVIRKLLNPSDYIKGKRIKKGDKENINADEGSALPDVKPVERETPVFAQAGDTVIEFNNGKDELLDNTQPAPSKPKKSAGSNIEFTVDTPAAGETSDDDPSASKDDEMEIVANDDEEGAKGVTLEPYDPKLDLENYHYPTLDLLDKSADDAPAVNMEEQTANKDRIITILRNFGVEISSIKATVGPTVTLYEITPAQGVRIAKIRNLEDDIALSLSALGIRIIAPIPGKGTIGIEVPNKNPRIVSMESVLNSKKFQESTYELPIALGKTITNEVFMADLTKLPHLLVAGATGQGKSVGLNAIITSLLYKKHPAELKFVMVDPKKVEFSIYAPIENHFLAKIPDENTEPIITDVTKVVQTLKSLCQEMDDRYDLLKRAHVRNIKEYNERFKARRLNPENGHRFMPYIVVIIDEFGDLIMTAGKEVELPIARIAQLARAVGIHMIIATQRPTTNIITGTIKANFPARMAFRTMAMIDSRTILDRPGANQLVGKGDMLFLAGSDPVRVQCAFVDTPEVEKITSYIAQQQSYNQAFELPEVAMDDTDGGNSADVDMTRLDPMFEDAARLIVVHQQGSTSLIQRKFSIGYNRAGRLMDQLEKAGIVGPAQGSKPRDVLCSDEADLEMKISSLG